MVDLVKSEAKWSGRAKRFLKAEIKRADATYEQLAKRLHKHSMAEKKTSMKNKIS